MEPLAHSAKPKLGIPAQSYTEHIENVLSAAAENARRSACYMTDGEHIFVEVVQSAACLHDLGKLDIENQKVLKSDKRVALPVNHVEAGTARLLRINHMESALMVYGHHAGLCSIFAEVAKGKEFFFRDPNWHDRTEKRLENYLQEHERYIKSAVDKSELKKLGWSGLTRRLALSCLVDADHGDTARHYGGEKLLDPPEVRWKERLRALDNYIESLSQLNPLSARNQQRRDIYNACRFADTKPSMQACDSPVGTGKTTAVMAHMLQAAIAKDLRHIVVVLPYTNIIKQSVDVYRKALTLPGENPEEIVAEHHHQADFDDIKMRQMTTLWKAPITVTTAVQFFETMGSNHPAKLRKLHELPGSAVFVDEAHAAIPSWLWPQTWLWLKELTQQWRCHFVLASGSLSRFWLNNKFVDPPESIPDLIPEKLRKDSSQREFKRITYHSCEEPLNRGELIDFVLSKRGPRLVILNTVQSAAVIAREMQKAGYSVLHLSTALVPIDRNRIVERILRRLEFRNVTEWTLVATSCVEAGMNFSFNAAFRESSATTSLIQIGGRANRHGDDETAEVWDFRVIDPLLNRHPAFDTSRLVLNKLFEEDLIQNLSATDAVTEAMRREIMSDYNTKTEIIKECERKCDYPEVAKLCRVIDADTRIVVIDKDIVEALEAWEKVSTLDLLRNSVQLWSQKINLLSLEPVRGHEELYKWTAPYDPDFLGYMEGVLPLVYAKEEGLII